VLGDDDVGVKVGDGPTLARYRVADPVEVGQALEILVAELRTTMR
jgi:trehalose 6-phosphate phosphatase